MSLRSAWHFRSVKTHAQSTALLLGCVVAVILIFLSFPAFPVRAEIEPESPILYPTPEPFSVNAWDAVQALWMIRRVGLLWYEAPSAQDDETGRYGDSSRVVRVDSVRAVYVGEDETYPAVHKERYNLVLNGEPIDWANLYIEYGGVMRNLQLLYTYRNQRPFPDRQYRLD